MDLKISLSVLAIAVFGVIGVLLILPTPDEDGIARLPWLIERDAENRVHVFNMTLGVTTLGEVRDLFNEDGKVNLFQAPVSAEGEESLVVEAFFERVYLQRLRADWVLTLDLPPEALADMYERGLRISKLGSGSRKIKLDGEDAAALVDVPVRSITYLPKARLDQDLLAQRFGEPNERITEKTGVVHWLYPDKGLDMARSPRGNVVLQYMNPADFDAALAKLQAAEAAWKASERAAAEASAQVPPDVDSAAPPAPATH